MFEAFGPLMALVLIYLVIALMSKAARKVSQAQKSVPRARPAASAGTPDHDPAPVAEAAPRPRTIQPTIRVTEHDDSVYQGSLNAVTGEGYDPCHEEQLAPLMRAESVEHAPAAAPGFRLNWTGDEIVRGFVISEILKRKGA